jgi:hypothetical protein
MHPLKEGFYGYKLVRALGLAGITFAILLADALTGFKRGDAVGRWICAVICAIAVAASVYYWGKLVRRGRGRRRSNHLNEPEATHRNPPAVLPPRRDQNEGT